MQHVLQYSKDWPNWQAGAARRLNVSMFVATLLVIGILSVVRFPTIDLLFPLMEIVVDIVNVNEPVEEAAPLPETVVEPLPQTVEPIAEPVPAEPVPAEQAVEEAPTPVAEPAAEAQPIPNAVVTLSIDWEFEKVQAVKDAIDALERVASVNPNFDQLRKEAAVKFRASRAPVKNEPWDYVDKDQAGRTILSYGNYYQVLDDPRLFNRDAFLTFERHMVYGMYRKHIPKELPWVKEIRKNYAYLRIREDRRNGIFATE